MKVYVIICKFGSGYDVGFHVLATNHANAMKKAKESVPDGYLFKAEEKP